MLLQSMFLVYHLAAVKAHQISFMTPYISRFCLRQVSCVYFTRGCIQSNVFQTGEQLLAAAMLGWKFRGKTSAWSGKIRIPRATGDVGFKKGFFFNNSYLVYWILLSIDLIRSHKMLCLMMIHTRKKTRLHIKYEAKGIQLTKNHTSLSAEGADTLYTCTLCSWYSLYPVSRNETDRETHAMF